MALENRFRRNAPPVDEETIFEKTIAASHAGPEPTAEIIQAESLEIARLKTHVAIEDRDNKAFMEWAPVYALLDRAEAEAATVQARTSTSVESDLHKVHLIMNAHAYAASLIRLDQLDKGDSGVTIQAMRLAGELSLAITARRYLAITELA